ncbi:MAG TPA: diacylglycerol kinase family lipid kinase [Chitinophagales bacterium]|nr:diacylglycerol kinase family lipid kinase [Chitinophagales bacterium]
MNKKWFVIINPVSGGKYAPKLWNKMLPHMETTGISFQVAFTEYIDHAGIIVKQAVDDGFQHFMIIGGDGTANDVINGIFNSTGQPENFVVAMIPAGTGNDWVRTIGEYKNIMEIPEKLQSGNTFLQDVGLVTFQKENATRTRYFINIAGLGFEGQVAKKLYEKDGLLKGTKLQYQLAILQSLFVYKHTRLTLTVDGVTQSQTGLSIAAGICKYNGGGLKQLPNAIIDDGLLDMTVIGSMTKLQMVMNLPKLRNGSHVKLKSVNTFRGKTITINSEPPIYLDADGEFLGTTPVTISLIPKAIQVLQF